MKNHHITLFSVGFNFLLHYATKLRTEHPMTSNSLFNSRDIALFSVVGFQPTTESYLVGGIKWEPYIAESMVKSANNDDFYYTESQGMIKVQR
jgi:hypothetical protein